MNKINFSETITELAKTTGFSKANIREVIDAFEEVLISHLKNGDQIKVTSGVTFIPKDTTPKTYRDPRTGELVNTTGRKSARVKFSNSFKSSIQ